MASGGEPAAIAAVATAASIPMLLHSPTTFQVVVPIIASWFGLVGIGILSERPVGQIMRQLGGTVLLGAVVGIVAMAVISKLEATGIFAALLTLTIAVSPAVIWKTLGSAGPRALDAALQAVGLERTDKDAPPDGGGQG